MAAAAEVYSVRVGRNRGAAGRQGGTPAPNDLGLSCSLIRRHSRPHADNRPRQIRNLTIYRCASRDYSTERSTLQWDGCLHLGPKRRRGTWTEHTYCARSSDQASSLDISQSRFAVSRRPKFISLMRLVRSACSRWAHKRHYAHALQSGALCMVDYSLECLDCGISLARQPMRQNPLEPSDLPLRFDHRILLPRRKYRRKAAQQIISLFCACCELALPNVRKTSRPAFDMPKRIFSRPMLSSPF